VLIDEFLAPKILIVSGKGGVGKTTVAAALALVAERNGRRVCIAEVDRKGSLPKLFEAANLSYEPSEMIPGIWGLALLPEEALAEYLAVQYHMRRVSRAFTSTQFVDYITTAAPGLKDILVLGKIWYLEQGRGGAGSRYDFDTIIVDAVYSELLNEQEGKTFARVAADRDLEELLDSADAVGLDLDGEDLDALLRYALFLDGRRRIQSRHLS